MTHLDAGNECISTWCDRHYGPLSDPRSLADSDCFGDVDDCDCTHCLERFLEYAERVRRRLRALSGPVVHPF